MIVSLSLLPNRLPLGLQIQQVFLDQSSPIRVEAGGTRCKVRANASTALRVCIPPRGGPELYNAEDQKKPPHSDPQARISTDVSAVCGSGKKPDAAIMKYSLCGCLGGAAHLISPATEFQPVGGR